jgi:hypothetical protein
MARCRRCGIEFKAAVDLDPDFCEACVADFLDEDYAGDEDDGVPCVDDHDVAGGDWMTDERY